MSPRIPIDTLPARPIPLHLSSAHVTLTASVDIGSCSCSWGPVTPNFVLAILSLAPTPSYSLVRMHLWGMGPQLSQGKTFIQESCKLVTWVSY